MGQLLLWEGQSPCHDNCVRVPRELGSAASTHGAPGVWAGASSRSRTQAACQRARHWALILSCNGPSLPCRAACRCMCCFGVRQGSSPPSNSYTSLLLFLNATVPFLCRFRNTFIDFVLVQWLLINSSWDPSYFLCEFITTDLVCNTSCWRFSMGRALGLCPNISRYGL